METRNYERLGPFFAALTEVGMTFEAVLYDDEAADAIVETPGRLRR